MVVGIAGDTPHLEGARWRRFLAAANRSGIAAKQLALVVIGANVTPRLLHYVMRHLRKISLIPARTKQQQERHANDHVESEFTRTGVFLVAPRAYWKGYLKLSLVSCPISLFPATSEREKVSFHQLHKQTGNRIKYKKVDAETVARSRLRIS
jgi:Ku70/Ku80-like protein